MHCSTCMGAGISMAHGMAKVLDEKADRKNRPVAVIGDSTFFHTGMNSLLDVAYNQSDVLTIILDNRTTAMTGGQKNPGMGMSLSGRQTPDVDLPALVRSLGIKRVAEIDPFDVARTEQVLKEELAVREPSVVIATSPCMLQYKIKRPPQSVDEDVCTGCKACLRARMHGAQPVRPERQGAARRDRSRRVQRLRGLRPALQVRRHHRP